ncbi:rho guanine nucleotide exchange factor 17 isoform X2 [Phlebotomus argentipes]|uniref:rho guanine nucleotide exchange factor 17 isoform X2 n=1 Tax=Phlebotomus argentipes TaxID=94469 RepID=UPI002892CBAB|nr:rho guanine nucleotide exchange factor 17 isoform X2 [Phlebotomus argentipes]
MQMRVGGSREFEKWALRREFIFIDSANSARFTMEQPSEKSDLPDAGAPSDKPQQQRSERLKQITELLKESTPLITATPVPPPRKIKSKSLSKRKSSEVSDDSAKSEVSEISEDVEPPAEVPSTSAVTEITIQPVFTSTTHLNISEPEEACEQLREYNETLPVCVIECISQGEGAQKSPEPEVVEEKAINVPELPKLPDFPPSDAQEVRKRHADFDRSVSFSSADALLSSVTRKTTDKSRRRKGIYIQWPIREKLDIHESSSTLEGLTKEEKIASCETLSCQRTPEFSFDDPVWSEGCYESFSEELSTAKAGRDALVSNGRQFSKRPLRSIRGPYGQMLEAELKKPVKVYHDHLALSLNNVNFPSDDSGETDRKVNTHPSEKSMNYLNNNKSCDCRQILTKNTSMDSLCSSYTKDFPPQRNSNDHSSAINKGLLMDLLHQASSCDQSSTEQLHSADIMPSLSPHASILQHMDTRTHIVIELYNTEQSYVESLQTIVHKYMNPLKSSDCEVAIDTQIVDDIFYMVPSILNIHEGFLEELKKRLDVWNSSQIIGDAFNNFSCGAVLEIYSNFVNNLSKARDSIRGCCSTQPSFARFLEVQAKEHKGKLPLDNLLIKPIQKFPNYELILSRLIKHTDAEHPDQTLLQEANKTVHRILLHINCKEREALQSGQREAVLREIESAIEGVSNLVTADRSFIAFDLVTIFSGQSARKERGLFLFSDLIILTSIKRRSGTVRKPNIINYNIAANVETNKYKFLTKIPISDLEFVKTKDDNSRKSIKEIEYLMEDSKKLHQILAIVTTLRCPHQHLEEAARELEKDLEKQLSEKQLNDGQLSVLEITIGGNSSGSDGGQHMSIQFVNPERRSVWEQAFREAKQKFASNLETIPMPEFISSIPIRKTRAGLQFTCAASTLGAQNDVWVCNSDGYVGQVCVLSLNAEPTVTSCNGVCNARILCVTSVPSEVEWQPDKGNTCVTNQLKSTPSFEESENCNKSLKVQSLSSLFNNIHLDSSSSSDNESEKEFPTDAKCNIHGGKSDLHHMPTFDCGDFSQSTMWLGTEDGCIHVYNCSDNIRIKRNKVKMQHSSAVYHILYMNNKVYVALANGELIIYTRENLGTGWNTSDPVTLIIGSVSNPITKLLNVDGKLWCSIQGVIKIFNVSTHQVESEVQISSESKPITNMVVSQHGVWISIQNSSVLKCFHSKTYEIVVEMNVSGPVSKMLSNCDDIIRQHKAACLRITALLACRDLICIGTSAGVLLVIQGSATGRNLMNSTPMPMPHGHTGHVRFLTSVETTEGSRSNSNSRKGSQTKHKESSILLISGGDGCEDFRNSNINSMNDIAGREDSTNHLLLWKV